MFYNFLFVFLIVGVANAFPGINRVVNGTDAEEGEYPFAASLRSSSGSHSCGCSILNERWILTAAHCVAGRSPSGLNIQYGVTVISATGPNIAKVKKIISHEKYNPGNNYINDIALLLLEEPLTLSDKVQPTTLPKQYHEVPGSSKATLVGWGIDKTGGTIQKHLQKVDLITFSDEDCNKRHNGRTHKSNICAGIPEGGKGQCSGDSGGPLIVNGEQLGIVSWSIKPCTVAPYPGVYTKVSHFVDWITEQIENNSE